MAKKQLDLPISGRQNIIDWLEQFRNSGKGLKQSTVDMFDVGNNYTTNAKVEGFNKKVKILVRAFKAAGIPLKKTPRGRFSITAIKLKQLTLDKFTDELYDFVFDERIANIKFDDPNVVDKLDKLHKEKKVEEFASIKYFMIFIEYKNIEALEWLVKTYGVKNYSLRNISIIEALDNDKSFESELLDFYLESKILTKETLLDMNSYASVRAFKNLSKESIKKILPLYTPYKENLYSLLDGLSDIFEIHGGLANYIAFDDVEWDIFVDYCVERINEINFYHYESFIEQLSVIPIFTEKLLKHEDWVSRDRFLDFIPEIKDIFIF